MVGFGTIINVIGVLLGGVAGLLFGKRISSRFQDILILANGVTVTFIGVSGVIGEMMIVENGRLESQGTMMMVISMAVGCLIGEWLDIARRMERAGDWLKEKTKSQGDGGFVDGFVTSSLIFCIGAMGIVGCIQDALQHDYTILVTKTIIDAITVMVLTASMGKGCIFSAISVGVYQGVITALAFFLAPFMTDLALSNLSMVGSGLIFCLGINFLLDRKIPVANMLPSMVVAVAYAFIDFL